MNTPSSPLRIGIQGVRAAFHEVAARKFFAGRPITAVECSSFTLLSQALRDGKADLCLMAIENSIAGSLLTNYALLEQNGFKIIGEVYLRIEMNLMALPGQSLADLTTVQSHPMALLQCADFLSRYPSLSVIESADTAESAKNIAEQKLYGHAAIASALAAEAYGLSVLCAGIESNKLNYTRFLVICREADYARPANANKASISFELADHAGSLLRVLEVFNQAVINMTKIQSVPILGRPYQYSFHADLEWQDQSRYFQALMKLPPLLSNLVHFGEYPAGERPIV